MNETSGRWYEKKLKSLTWGKSCRKLACCEWRAFPITPQRIFYTFFKIKTEKDKFGKGLKAKIGFVFQVISVIAPIKTRGHSPSPLFKKNASKNFAQHSQKLSHLLLQNFWFCFSLGYYRTCSRVTSDDTYILNKKYEVSPKLVCFESTTCKQC